MIRDIKITLPESVEFIISKLNEHGFEAYAVGGCVRDSILHKEPKDWDITTSARPGEVKNIFSRTIDTGIEHGTVTVMIDKVGYEVTTYRIDGEYGDGRHPDSVEFSDNLVADLERRDFTINAMAYSTNTGLVDEYDGIGDIDNKLIRCVRDARLRFSEDALRMMRAVRFSAQLGFTIDGATLEAIKELAPTIKKISHERIQVEFTKTILSPNPKYVSLYESCHILEHVLPVLNRVLSGENKERVLNMLGDSEENMSVRYAVLLFLEGTDNAAEELKNLRLDNETIKLACRLIDTTKLPVPQGEYEVRSFMNRYGSGYFNIYCGYMRAYAKNFVENYNEYYKALEAAEKIYEKVVSSGECVSLKQLKVTGDDLMQLGIPKGKEIGLLLNNLLEEVLKNPEHNDKEWLINNLNNYK